MPEYTDPFERYLSGTQGEEVEDPDQVDLGSLLDTEAGQQDFGLNPYGEGYAYVPTDEERRAVEEPAGIFSSLWGGLTEGSAELIEAPENVINWVGQQFGLAEDTKLNLLSHVGDWVRDLSDVDNVPETWGSKISYFIGYAIPDAIGVATGAGVGAGILKGLGHSSKLATVAGRVLGAGAYGAARGGHEIGSEYALLEAAYHILSPYTRKVQMVGNAVLMGSLAALHGDPTSESYQDDILGAAIFGGVFGAMGPSGKRDLLKDAELNMKKAGLWGRRQKRLSKPSQVSDYMEEFASHNYAFVRKSVLEPGQTPKMKDFIRERIGRILDEDVTGLDGDDLAEALHRSFLAAPGGSKVDITESTNFAKAFVQMADVLENPSKYAGDDILGKLVQTNLIDDIQDQVLKVGKEAKDFLKTQDIDLGGGFIVKGTKEEFEEVAHNANIVETVKRREDALHSKYYSNLKERISQGYKNFLEKTVHPEGSLHLDLEAAGGGDVSRALRMRYYTATAIDARVDRALQRVGYSKMHQLGGPDLVDTFHTYINHIVEFDKIKRGAPSTYKIKGLEFEINNIPGKVRRLYGDDAAEALLAGKDAYFEEIWGMVDRIYKEKLIDKNTYDTFLTIRHSPTEVISKIERRFNALQDPDYLKWFGKKFDVASEARRLKVKDIEAPILDSEYRLQQHIARLEYWVAKNRPLREGRDFAKANPGNLLLEHKDPTSKYYRMVRRGNKSYKEYYDNPEDYFRQQKVNEAVKAERVAQAEALAKTPITEKEIHEKTRQVFARHNKALDKYGKRVQELEKLRAEAKEVGIDLPQTPKPKATNIAERVPETPQGAIDLQANKTILENVRKIEADTKRLEVEIFDLKHKGKYVSIGEELVEPSFREGFVPIKYTYEGKDAWLGMPREVAKFWDIGGQLGTEAISAMKLVGNITGVRPLKLMAVGINPAFAVAAYPRDTFFFYLTSQVEQQGFARYLKESLRDLPDIIRSIKSKDQRYYRYSINHGNRATITSIATDNLLARKQRKFMEGYRGANKFSEFVDKASWLGVTMEEAVRINQVERDLKHLFGKDLLTATDRQIQQAVDGVNRQLNFYRRGPWISVLNEFYPFLSASAQALDGMWQAAKTNPKLYAQKVGTYWAGRMATGLATYAVASEVMDQVSPRDKISNIIVPLGITTRSEGGDLQHGYFRIPLERNPLTMALDAMFFGMIDVVRATPGERDGKIKQWWDIYASSEILQFGISEFMPPTLQAWQAMFHDIDPLTKDSIWRGDPMVNMVDRFNTDTHPLAKAVAPPLGAAPVGIERAAGIFGGSNMFTSTAGFLLRDVDDNEREYVSHYLKEAVPGLSRFMKFTGSNTEAQRNLIREEASARKIEVMDFADGLYEDIRRGDLTDKQAYAEVRNSDIPGVDKTSIIRNLQARRKGDRLFERLREKNKTLIDQDIPTPAAWRTIQHAPAKAKARWYLDKLPEDKEAAKLFKQLTSAYGFSSNEFGFWLRKLRKGED